MKRQNEQSPASQISQLEKELAANAVELKRKNRDLEVEASLERVRTVTMGMRKPDELLNICQELFEELKGLGFGELRNAMINIMNDKKGSFLNYDFNDSSGATVTQFLYNSHPMIERQVKMTSSASDAFSEDILTGDELEDFKAFRIKNGETADPKLENVTALYYYFYSIGVGSVGISSFSSLPEEKRNVLRRFRNVFDFAYRRYTDVSQAEAQAREAQIELGLERVRARAMAMQSSSELADLVTTLFNELAKLDFALSWCMINIIDGDSLSNTVWAKNAEAGGAPERFYMKFEGYPFHNAMWDAWKGKLAKFVYTLEGDEKKIYDEYLFNKTEFSRLPETLKAGMRATERYVASFSFSNFGGLQTVGDTPLSDASLDILSRFGKVFDLTYTRFNDLKQAEEQAREAQIELGLERVRARAMAMQSSDELARLVTTLFNELSKLHFTLARCLIWIIDADALSATTWMANPGVEAASYQMKYFDHPYYKGIIKAWKERNPKWAYELKGKEKRELDDIVFNLPALKDTPEVVKVAMRAIDKAVLSFSFSNFGGLQVDGTEPLSEDNSDILARFSKVFDQTYTRFSDLKKAEAQAREALIEGALERVRSRAMAMHKTDELGDAAELLYKELIGLGIDSLSVCYVLVNAHDKTGAYYGINPVDGKMMSIPMIAPHTETKEMRALWASWLKQEPACFIALDPEVSVVHQTYIGKLMASTFAAHGVAPEFTVEGFLSVSPERVHIYSLNFKQGYLFLVGGAPLAAADIDILIRFTKVFELTYTRFLDLKKAEAQAREGQIELALERVRARTMAMQHSDELVDAAAILFKQVKDLSVEVWTCGFQIWKPGEPGTTIAYMTLPDGTIRVPFDIPHPPEPFLNRAYEAAVRGDQFYVEELGGDALAAHYKYMLALPGASDRMVDISSGGFHLPGFQVNHNAFFQHGSLLFITYKPVPESWDIFKRFAKVFEQTYTRFLDLKKAEAQAREALIEGALERVRSRAMAMHKTDELREAAELLAKELTGLGIESITVCYVLVNEKDKTGAYYGVNPIDGKIQAQPTIMPHTETKVMRALWASWLKQEPVHFIALDPKASIAHQTYIGKLIASAFAAQGIAPEFTVEGFLSESPERVHIYSLNFKQGYLFLVGEAPLPAADVDILIRFTKVFELTYTRFLDLKQAEEQAREAKIEAALERVRSRTMAMQHSSELAETVSVLFAQLLGLGITPDQIRTCGIVTFDAQEPIGETWITETNGDINPVAFKSQYDEAPAYKKIYAAWKKGEKFEVLHLRGEKLTEHLGYVVKYAPVHIRDIDAPELPTEIWQHVLFFSQGYLFVITREPLPEYHDVFKRFGAVLQQSYTRFLDLQKAEAQAHEGRIELALERVRARTMAMQHSNELAETAFILFQQFRELGENPDQATIGIINEAEGVIEYWVTIYGNQTNKVFKFPIDEPNVTCKIYDAWKAQEKSLVIDLSGQALYDFSKFRESMGGAGYNPDEKRRIINVAFFSKGLINVQSTVTRSAESLRLLERFANVFEGTYTRFLDLKKAEAQAREGQIELALERVRARAMAMRDSKELSEMVSTVFGELTKLDFSLTRCAIVIADSESGGRMIWMANSEAGQPPISFYRKSLDHPYPNAVNEEWKKRTTKWVYHLKGAEKKGMDDYYANSEEVAHLSSVIKQAMDMPESIILSHSFNNFGYLRADSLEFLSEANLDILYRFAKVFDLGYTRFTDIKQAEAQAREAQIELALERVRAKTMAMQHSDELLETSQVVFQQLRDLGETADQISIAIVKEDEGIFDLFATIYGTQMVRVVHPKIDDHYVMGRVYKNWKAHKKSFVVELGGEELRQYNILRNQLGGVDYYNEIIGPDDRWIVSAACFSNGILSFSSSTEPTKEAGQLLERFAKVFEQTYTRFIDLQRAEAQTWEAQIQLALERVRARTMAMQHSEELKEVVLALYEQLQHLDFDASACNIITNDQNSRTMQYWVSGFSQEIYPVSYTVPYLDHPYHDALLDPWRQGAQYSTIEYAGRMKKSFDKIFFTHTDFKNVPEAPKKTMIGIPSVTFSTAYVGNVAVQALGHAPLSEENMAILRRFAIVFEQTYTRFLDLKKAEAQAREAQIELSLERVRAKTMAMHQSDELSQTALLLFQQLKELGLSFFRTGFYIWRNDADTVEGWMSNGGLDGILPSLVLPFKQDDGHRGIYEAALKGETTYEQVLGGDELMRHYEWLMSQPSAPMNFERFKAAGLALPDTQYKYAAIFKGGYLLVIATEPQPVANDLLKRFAKVFEQTYTRFLDLKNAEVQARESQIQLALERVRARTMAMQRSEELPETANLLFTQVQELGMPAWSAGYCNWTDNKKAITFWMSSEGVLQPPFSMPTTEDPSCIHMREAAERGETFYVEEVGGEALVKHYEYMRTLPVVGEVLDSIINAGHPLPTFQIFHLAYFAHGFLLFIAYEPVPEAHEIFKRFARVFEQTYTRFLDLQKAETQARESQVQLALERIRARTMAMQKSDELAETVSLLFKQLLDLGIRQEQIRTCGIVTFDDNEPVGEQWVTETNGEVIPQSFMVPYTEIPAYISIYESWKKGEKFKIIHLQGELLKQHFRYLDKHANVPIRDVVARRQAKEIYNHVLFFSQGYLFIITKEALPGYHDVFKRFGAVFQQSYTRFLDLKKAEAQAREGQIQLAMERVRARTMAMQRSDELMEASHLLDSQVRALGIRTRGCAFNIYGENESTEWFGLETGPLVYKTPREEAFLLYYEAGQRGDSLYINEFAGDACKAHYEYLCTLPDVGDALKKMRDNGQPFPAYQIDHVVYFKFGYLLFITFEPVPEAHDIFKRFAAVFEQTYTRFLDLQKAEEQARESQIEAALERVRSRSMGMQKSDELKEVIQIIYEQFVHLNINIEHTGFVVDYSAGADWHFWIADHLGSPNKLTIPDFDSAWRNDFNGAKEKGVDFFATNLSFDEKNKFYKDLFDRAPGMPEEAKEVIFSKPGFAGSTVLLENVALYIENFEGIPYTDAENATLMRFGKVFQQTYTRFLDLQRAEEQVREAQIEAALERVRSKTMAMHNSEDVGDTIIILFDELTRLGFATLRCSIDILNDTSMMEIWTAKPGENGKADLVIGHLDTALHPMLGAMYNAWKAKKPDFFYELAGDDQARYLTALNEYAGYAINYEIASMPARQFLNTFFFADGGILAWTAEPLHAEASLILTRFASVFGQTYRRYLDLQKAETQAREAQIEMALERVRAVAMSMRKPGELLEISQTIFTQLKALDFADLRNTEIIINSDEKESVISYYYSDYGVTGIIEVFFNEHPTVKAWANEMRKANDAFTEMVIPEDEIAAWRKYREEIGYKPDPKLDEAKEVFYYSYSIGLGGLSISSFTPINDDQKKILERFRNVFNLSYQRYADIARAEEQAKEATKQASLDRVRAEIASMRTTGDLERITPLIWNELTILGIPFIRCGVFIVDEQAELIHTHLSTPDGRALAAFDLHFDADGIGQNVLAAWRKKQSAVIHWTAEEFAANTKSQVERGAVKARERFVTEHPDTSLDLHFFPFLQGMLYVGNIEPLNDDAKDLVQSLAEAFSTAYARYEDFNKLEAAKQQVDKTLTDLKSAQTQLIQTEKMASLGELTAGIAHEIQNPLNFVNNFSEVNAELIEEMKAEIEKGDLEEIKALALDIEENSKKINQHGKRADGIVKGMLQHSQSGSGVKELTNINTVADEYMRLAYHGLRAKDKSFNAEMHTHFDPALPKINVIPQDIGRVLLNLFNNAFYAVNQKMKTAGADYKPMVEVETFFLPLQGVGGLKVKDNGIGIPDAIKEKIMQPFFTTKPTGEGTGLGLSLTYDMVVKGHGGSIQVDSVEGEGSEFIITLPIS